MPRTPKWRSSTWPRSGDANTVRHESPSASKSTLIVPGRSERFGDAKLASAWMACGVVVERARSHGAPHRLGAGAEGDDIGGTLQKSRVASWRPRHALMTVRSRERAIDDNRLRLPAELKRRALHEWV